MFWISNNFYIGNILSIYLMLILILFSPHNHAEIIFGDEKKLKFQGDFRLRYENDWDSEQANGIPREDRERLRIRTRLGAEIEPLAGVTLAARLRTGPKDGQQSPHVTIIDFEYNPTGNQDAVFDKWFVHYATSSFWIWGGRNNFPYWKQNELFWDDDVTPAGLAAGYDFSDASGKLSFTGGCFTLPDGAINFHGNLTAGQITYVPNLGNISLIIAGGIFAFGGEKGSENLLTGNGGRDYMLWVGNAQLKFNEAQLPITIGVDVMHNSENYSNTDPDPFTVINRDQVDGYVLSIAAGKSRNPGDWVAGYYYAHLETLAVNASYAQDDWMRWGNADQTDASNFKGHEFRMGVTLTKKFGVLARLYLVDSITTVQDGKRFRIDLNYEF